MTIDEKIEAIIRGKLVITNEPGVKLAVQEIAKLILEPVEVYYSVQNGGDGSAYPRWFLSFEDAERDQEQMSEGWGESCTGTVQTYVGSVVYNQAVLNSKNLSY